MLADPVEPGAGFRIFTFVGRAYGEAGSADHGVLGLTSLVEVTYLTTPAFEVQHGVGVDAGTWCTAPLKDALWW